MLRVEDERECRMVISISAFSKALYGILYRMRKEDATAASCGRVADDKHEKI